VKPSVQSEHCKLEFITISSQCLGKSKPEKFLPVLHMDGFRVNQELTHLFPPRKD